MKSLKRLLAAAVTLAASTLHTAGAHADSVADAIATCAGCHGENGVPIDKTFPVIAGQNRNYILNQLHDFKTGRRKNEIMAGIVAEMSKTDMEAIATHFSKQAWPVQEAQKPSAEIESAAETTLSLFKCDVCHHPQYQGDTVRPRLAGQNEEYLLKTMQDFRDKARGNYIGMSAVLGGLSDDDLKGIASYLASLPAPKGHK